MTAERVNYARVGDVPLEVDSPAVLSARVTVSVMRPPAYAPNSPTTVDEPRTVMRAVSATASQALMGALLVAEPASMPAVLVIHVTEVCATRMEVVFVSMHRASAKTMQIASRVVFAKRVAAWKVV